MAIGLSYLPASAISRMDEASPEEKSDLESVKATFREPANFDFEDAFVYLRNEVGMDDRSAMDTIAKKLGEKSGFDVVKAREAGFTTDQIVAKLIGRAADDLNPAILGSLAGETARGFTEALPGALVGTGAAAAVAASGGTLLPIIGAGLLANLAFEKLTGAGDKLEDFLFEERQLLPSERGVGAFGRIAGSVLTFSPTTKIGLSAIEESVDLGSKKLLARHMEKRSKDIQEKLGVGPSTALSQAYTEAIPAAVRRREFFEKTAASIGQKAREQGNLRFAVNELGASIIPAAFEGFSEYMAPGNTTMRTVAGLSGALIPTSPIASITLEGAKEGTTRVRQSVAEKGVLRAVTSGFGSAEAIKSAREIKAANFLADTYRKALADPRAEADPEFDTFQLLIDDLERLIRDDPEMAAVLSPGQLTNDPVLLMNEAIRRRADPSLAVDQKEAVQKANESLATYIATMRQTGNPQLLREAAKLEENALSKQLTLLLETYLVPAAVAGEKIPLVRAGGKTSLEIKTEQGQILKDAVAAAMTEAKKVRKTLYDEVDKRVSVSTAPLLSAAENLRSEFLMSPGAELPDLIKRNLKIFGMQEPTAEVKKELQDVASQIKTLENRKAKIGTQFKKLGEKDPDAFGEFDLLVDTKTAATSASYPRRLANVESALDPDLPQRTRNNVIKLTELARNSDDVDVNLQAARQRLNSIQAQQQASADPKAQLGELLAFRNDLRKMLRDSQKGVAQDVTYAQLSVLDEGATNAVRGAIAESIKDPNMQALSKAEAYNRAYHDTFTRTFLGELNAKDARGRTILAENAMDKLFATNTGTRFRNAVDTIEGLQFQGIEDESLVGSVEGAIDLFLRNNLADKAKERVIDLGGGRTETIFQLDQKTIDDFRRQNADLLQKIDPTGELIDDLSTLEKAQVRLDAAVSTSSERAKKHAKESVLGKFLKADSAEATIMRVIESKEPVSGLRAIVRKINAPTTNPAQQQELRDALYSVVLSAATRHSGEIANGRRRINFEKLDDFLFNTGAKRENLSLLDYPEKAPSVMSILKSSGGVPFEQADELKKFLSRGKEIQKSIEQGPEAFLDLQENDLMKDFVARFAGAQIVSEVAKSMGLSPTIQTTGAGAQFAKNAFINLPAAALNDILINISKPGEAKELVRILKKAKTAKDEVSGNFFQKGLQRVARSLIGSPSYLQSLGAREVLAEERPITPIEEKVVPVSPPAPPIPAPQPAVLTPDVMGQAAPPAAPAQGLRQRYAALYPDDPISPLIESQGIGTLPR